SPEAFRRFRPPRLPARVQWKSLQSAEDPPAADTIGATTVSACSHGCVRLVCRRESLAVGRGKERRMNRPRRAKKAKVQAKRPPVRKSAKDADGKVRDLEKRLAEALKREAEALEQQTATAEVLLTRNRELSEAQTQQTATAEILRLISSSPTDFQTVFDTIVRNAATLCEAFDAIMVLADGDEFVQRAHHGPIEAVLRARYSLRGTVNGRAILEARVIQVENLAEASDYPAGRALAQRVGYRTTLSVPLLRAGVAIGAIGIRRTEILPFSDKQIE